MKINPMIGLWFKNMHPKCLFVEMVRLCHCIIQTQDRLVGDSLSWECNFFI